MTNKITRFTQNVPCDCGSLDCSGKLTRTIWHEDGAFYKEMNRDGNVVEITRAEFMECLEYSADHMIVREDSPLHGLNREQRLNWMKEKFIGEEQPAFHVI